MASEASELVNELKSGLLGGFANELVDWDGFETSPRQFGDGSQGGCGGGHGEWCWKFKISYVC